MEKTLLDKKWSKIWRDRAKPSAVSIPALMDICLPPPPPPTLISYPLFQICKPTQNLRKRILNKDSRDRTDHVVVLSPATTTNLAPINIENKLPLNTSDQTSVPSLPSADHKLINRIEDSPTTAIISPGNTTNTLQIKTQHTVNAFLGCEAICQPSTAPLPCNPNILSALLENAREMTSLCLPPTIFTSLEPDTPPTPCDTIPESFQSVGRWVFGADPKKKSGGESRG